MRIGIHLTPDGRRFEFDLIPDDEMWRLNPVGRSAVNRCNEAGLIAALELVRQTAPRVEFIITKRGQAADTGADAAN